jgi:hypothetical protein
MIKKARRRLWTVLVLVCIVPLLTGCMEALQTGQHVNVSPPAVSSSPTLVATVPPPTIGQMNPTLPGSLASDPATAAPTQEPTQALTPSLASTSTATTHVEPLPPLALFTPTPFTNESRWRDQQIGRHTFEPLRHYGTASSELWWYDPINQQSVILGRITGDFSAQAEFTLRGQGVPALEVPYQVNLSYGLTALSPALLDRIRAAGYSAWIETYVFLTPSVNRR